MKKIKTEKIGDVTASLYLESLGYTYKIRAKIKGSSSRIVARSYAYITDRKKAEELMQADLFNITQQLKLF